MALKKLKELKAGDKFTFKNAMIMKGVYKKVCTSVNGFCLIEKTHSFPGDTFASSEDTFVESFDND